jgi:hypothetical protein
MKINRKIILIVSGVIILLCGLVLIVLNTDIFKKKNDVFIIPEEYEVYENELFNFKYPESFEVVELERDGVKAYVVQSSGSTIEIEIEYQEGEMEVYNEANNLFKTRNYHKYNQAPREIKNKNITGYYFTRYLQNVEFDMLSDEAYLQSPEVFFKLKMSLIGNYKDFYERGHEAFLLILNSIEMSD